MRVTGSSLPMRWKPEQDHITHAVVLSLPRDETGKDTRGGLPVLSLPMRDGNFVDQVVLFL